MTRDNIIKLPNPHLRQRSQKVGIINEDIKHLISDMADATINWEQSRDHEVGVALAAVQIDKLLRVVVIRDNLEDKDNHDFSVFINPVITKYEGELIEDFEGCLSVPDIYGKVRRYNKIRVRFMDIEGREHRLTAEGFKARIFQHEIDHTNGIVFIDHIKNDSQAFFNLSKEGKLEAVDYEKDVRNNSILW